MFVKEYAKALYELASSEKKLNEVEDNFKILNTGIEKNEDYMKVLTYPRISNDNKKKSIDTVCKSMEKLFINFLYVLIDNNRIAYLKEIYCEFKNIVDRNNNIVYADVFSAKDLNKSQISLLEKSLSKYFSGKKVITNIVIDKDLIGGLKVQAEGQLIDVSLTNRLESLMNTI